MRADLRITMTFENLITGERVTRCLDLDSFIERIAIRMEKPFTEVMSFNGLAQAMVARQHRHDTMERFGRMFADYLDDRDGWQGVSRQAAIEDLERGSR